MSEREDSFERAWHRYGGLRDGETTSPELKPLVQQLHAEVLRQPTRLRALKSALERTLLFLSSPAGRTHANCSAVDLFFAFDDAWPSDAWEHLPEAFADVLADIGGALHDAVKEPHIAEKFSSLPEQLLARVRSIDISERAV